jgi:TetR/AcrR family transcriptional regulator, transcriptional repressor for nem operon
MTAPPVTERGRSSRQRIIDVACDLFYRQGVSATGLAEITHRSGTGKGQLYHFFDDKNALVLAVIDAQIESAVEAETVTFAAMSTADELRGWADKAVTDHSEAGSARCPLGALVAELAEREPRLRAALDIGFRRWRDAIRLGLARLQEHRVLRSDRDLDDLAEILLCAYEGGSLMSELRGHTGPLRLALDTAIESMLV